MPKIKISSLKNRFAKQRILAVLGLLFLIILSSSRTVQPHTATQGFEVDGKLHQVAKAVVKLDD